MSFPAIERQEPTAPEAVTHRRNFRSLAIVTLAWLVLQLGGIFSPGLLDDVDSIYIQIAREMLQRHDFVTPYVNGIRFFDKPPLMYWMAAASMKLFGISAWAARLPLAIAVLALLLSTYALGTRLFAHVSPSHAPDRGGFYSAVALATAIGPYLYTRFFIPDIVLTLWLTLSIHLFLIALERIEIRTADSGAQHMDRSWSRVRLRAKRKPPFSAKSPLLPCIAFAAVTALNVLTKGFVGLLFPLGFLLLYLAFTRRLRLLQRFHLWSSLLVFLAIALPWHILIALRNPAIPMPAGMALPAKAGWAWFYLYNEHIARFFSRRIPHDYGQTPVWLFWLYTAIWTMPWLTFVPSAVTRAVRDLRACTAAKAIPEAALTPVLWAGMILGFFTVSARQEYYALPAIPAFTLMAGGLLAHADNRSSSASRAVLRASALFLTPLTSLTALVCGYLALFAPPPPSGTSLSDLLASNPALYNVSLGHLFDLTAPAMSFFRAPLAAVAVGMLLVGPVSVALRTRCHTYAANLIIAAGMVSTLLGAHAGLVRFYPVIGSEDLAAAIKPSLRPDDFLLIDCEFTCGSSLLFYTDHQVHVVNGHFNGLWYGSFWPDCPELFEDDASLHNLWRGPRRVFLLTYHPQARQRDLSRFGAVNAFARSGGKSILTNH